MKNILILGGTGFVGRSVCTKLLRQGWQVTVPSRQSAPASLQPAGPSIRRVQADVHDEGALTRLLAGVDAVVNLVAILHGSEAAFEQVHVELPKKLARACAAAGVRRLVHVSALGAALDAPSMYQRSKARGEAALQAAAAAGTLDLTVLRPSVIFGAQDKFLNMFAKLQRVFPVMPLAGADTRFQPVWVDDVAEAVLRCLQDDATIGQTYEACGPDVFTLRELVKHAGQWAGVNGGRGRPVIGLPTGTGAPAGLADGTGPRRAADEPRQPRFDGGGQRRQRHRAGAGRAGHHDRRAGRDRTGLPAQALSTRSRAAPDGRRPHQSGRDFASIAHAPRVSIALHCNPGGHPASDHRIGPPP